LVKRLKGMLRVVSDSSQHSEVVKRELKWQAWSMKQPEFHTRLAAVKRRIATWKSTA
jgi:hypothetical protein